VQWHFPCLHFFLAAFFRSRPPTVFSAVAAIRDHLSAAVSTPGAGRERSARPMIARGPSRVVTPDPAAHGRHAAGRGLCPYPPYPPAGTLAPLSSPFPPPPPAPAARVRPAGPAAGGHDEGICRGRRLLQPRQTALGSARGREPLSTVPGAHTQENLCCADGAVYGTQLPGITRVHETQVTLPGLLEN
jgi:hypothetical protein